MMNKLSKLSPLLFTIFGVVFLGFVSIKQFMTPRSASILVLQILTIVFYVIYMGFESKISIKELDKNQSHEHDKNTMELAALVKLSLLFSCLGLGNTLISHEHYMIVGILGFLLMILGFFVRGQSILNLGENYGHRIRPIGSYIHEKGIYSIIRHGAYSGTFFIHLGVTLIFLNIASIAFVIVWLGVVILRIKIEENLLMKDERYRKYANKTKYKMIPFIW